MYSTNNMNTTLSHLFNPVKEKKILIRRLKLFEIHVGWQHSEFPGIPRKKILNLHEVGDRPACKNYNLKSKRGHRFHRVEWGWGWGGGGGGTSE